MTDNDGGQLLVQSEAPYQRKTWADAIFGAGADWSARYGIPADVPLVMPASELELESLVVDCSAMAFLYEQQLRRVNAEDGPLDLQQVQRIGRALAFERGVRRAALQQLDVLLMGRQFSIAHAPAETVRLVESLHAELADRFAGFKSKAARCDQSGEG